MCRHCHIQYDKLQTNIHDHDGDTTLQRWTKDEYDNLFQDEDNDLGGSGEKNLPRTLFDEFEEPLSGESDTEIEKVSGVKKYGVRNQCIFNKVAFTHYDIQLWHYGEVLFFIFLCS